MRIAFFTETFYPQVDGVVTRLRSTIDILLEQGHKILLFTPKRGLTSYKGASIVSIEGINLPFYPDKQFSFPYPSIQKPLQNFQPDIIHAVNPLNIGAFGIYYARRLNVPLVSSYHTHIAAYASYYRVGFLESAAWKYMQWLHNQSQLNLCTSDSTLRELQRHKIRRVHLWERGIDRTKFHAKNFSKEMRERLSQGHPDRTLLLYVGRLGHEKGLDTLLSVVKNHPNTTSLAFVGDGPARQKLELLFSGTQTVFTGFLFGQELAQAYASADVFVFPSTTDTLGLVLLEAMVSGLPIIAARSGPTCEFFKDGESALLFEGEENLNQKVHLLLQDQTMRKRLSEKSLELSEGLDWYGPTQQLYEYYKRTIALHQRFQQDQRRRTQKIYKDLASIEKTNNAK